MKEPDQQALMTAFEKVEAEELEQGIHEKYLALANRLADRFGVSRVASKMVLALDRHSTFLRAYPLKSG